WPADAMATTSTHDLPSLSGWWRGGSYRPIALSVPGTPGLDYAKSHTSSGLELRARSRVCHLWLGRDARRDTPHRLSEPRDHQGSRR
ncbi:hypothetical protein FA290_30045, partial [Pseudomonas aeruginosa]|nr:hypothetical protein [Pseudomonas aeruginosa]